MNAKKLNKIDLIVSILLLVITVVGFVLRLQLHENDTIKFIIDTQGNINGVIVCSFLFMWWDKATDFARRELIILSVGIGLVLYEFIQLIIPWQTFDLKDIFGTFIGIAISSFINFFVILFQNPLRKDQFNFLYKSKFPRNSDMGNLTI
jgi:hypothetical protein